MRTYDFSPFWRSTVGFDHLVHMLDTRLRQAADDNYPPYNIERSGEDAYRISLAVAGFGVNDVTVTAEHNTLTIEGRKPEAPAREFLYQGIAARPFRRAFNLTDYVHVKEAAFRDGLLIVDLVREVPESMKPRRIPIGPAGSSGQIEQKQAA